MARTRAAQEKNGNGATLGFEATPWQAADKLRNNMDAAEYKHVVLGLIFLKYISDAFEEQHAKLVAEQDEGADPEHPDEYRAAGIFWVPKEARWNGPTLAGKCPPWIRATATPSTCPAIGSSSRRCGRPGSITRSAAPGVVGTTRCPPRRRRLSGQRSARGGGGDPDVDVLAAVGEPVAK